MATPMTATQILAALSAEGVDVREYKDWRNHNRNHKGAWGPVNGIVIHHTAGRDSLALCYSGTSALPGPLCHTHLAKSGVAHMVGNGRANHAGMFAENAMDAMRRELSVHPVPGPDAMDANARTYGIEIENLGNGVDFYPSAQYDAAVRWAAAICRFHGWSANSVIGHKEGTRRKIDPAGPVGSAKGAAWSMDKFRADVQKRLDGPQKPPSKPEGEKPKPKPVVDLSNVIAAARKDPGLPQGKSTYKADALLVEKALAAEGLLPAKWVDGSFGTLTVKAYAAWQRKCGHSGKAADGIPGMSTLAKLGKKHGWGVKA
ncbi:peptidoglycan recognition protein family protein [Streptomyces narbonensis]|uniref:peptidoglycan recognition protein family protein n=1 Tax=Streptomyces narbonensis TaxID=67333 RepID=UPI0033D66C3E